jgi:broad-specificity NMP kinase
VRTMQEIIVITGTPGTGKTRYAKAMSKRLGYAYLDGNRIIEDRLPVSYDKTRRCKVVDADLFARSALEHARETEAKGVVIDSHLSHHLPHTKVNRCIVMRCPLRKLKARLARRGYSDKKTRENLDAEIFEICLTEALEAGHKVKQVWT